MRTGELCKECGGCGRSYFTSRKLPCPTCMGTGRFVPTPIERYIEEKPPVSLPGRYRVPAYILETLKEAGLD